MKALIFDSGMFGSVAQELAKQFDKVYYYNYWQGDGFPMPNDYFMWTGFEFEKVWDFWEYVDKVDVIIFPDILNGDLQHYLRMQGYNVWGSGYGEELEIRRVDTKKMLKAVGLNVGEYDVVEGFKELKKFLEDKKDRYIKVDSDIRGLKETWHFIDSKISEPLLNEIQAKITGYEESVTFIVEQPLKSTIEAGIDTFNIDGEFPKKGLCAYEIKNESYFGRVMTLDNVPLLNNTQRKIAPLLKQYGYKGWYSTEEKVVGNKSYPIDWTCRLGFPSGASQLAIIDNWGEIISVGARGIMVQPKFNAQFVGELVIECPYSKDNQNAIYYPDKIKDMVKMIHCLRKDGVTYTVPKNTNVIGTLVATGSSPTDVRSKIEEASKLVKGYEVCLEIECLDKAIEAYKNGLKFS